MSNLSRLQNVCRYASVVMTAAEAVLAIIVIMNSVFGIGAFFNDGMKQSLTRDWLHLDSPSDTVLAAACLEQILILILGFLTVMMLRKIMVSVSKEHSPFTEENATRMKAVSVIYLVSSPFLLILGFLMKMNISHNIFVFLGVLLVSVVTYCLALMCRYGHILQDESDMTL